MTDDKLKLSLSIAGAFIVGASDMYFQMQDRSLLTVPVIVSILMSGLKGVGIYIVGYTQVNPRLQPRSSEQLLASVKASDMPAAVKAQVAPALAVEAAKPPPVTVEVVRATPPPLLVTLPATPEGLDPILYADCLAVTRFNAAPSLEAFRLLPADEQAVWRVYVAEARRREKESSP